MTPESRVVRRIMRFLESQGAYVVKHHGSAFARVGVPDLLACIDGCFVALEVKEPKRGRATRRQLYEIDLIRAASGTAEVVTCVDDVRAIVEGIRP